MIIALIFKLFFQLPPLMVPVVEKEVQELPEELAELVVVRDVEVHNWQRMLHK